jgi:hypothetical protein
MKEREIARERKREQMIMIQRNKKTNAAIELTKILTCRQIDM